jgi:putative protease
MVEASIKQDVSLLAPVGSFDSLMAAIAGGANAVYFGIEQLNMRARSSINFTVEDLEQISKICHQNQINAYLTLNTIIYDHDIRLMKTIIDAAISNNIDAVIAMDHAVIAYCNERGMPVHISTQVNVTNLETVKFYAHFADVMVLSRELTLQQVAAICNGVKKENIKGPNGQLIKIENFIHGALCMAVSGKCYLSLHTMNSSANRGACKQNCRRSYEVKDDEGNELLIDNEYIMSPKDLSTIGFVHQILDAGVSILKIEGRSKGPEYVKEVTRCYREAIDLWQKDTLPELAQIEQWEERLNSVYNRGFWGGYFLGKKMGEWTDTEGSKATLLKQYVGKGNKYFPKVGIGEFQLEKDQLHVGDQIMITGPSLGVHEMTVPNLRLADGTEVTKVEKGEVFSMPVEVKIRNSDKLFKVVPRT